MNSIRPRHDVAVLGCGNMGSAIARTAVAAGYRTVVWNRTPARTLWLQDAGATVATSAGDAMTSADLTIVCVSTTEDVNDLLRSGGPIASGATVLNLTSGTSDDATGLAAWAAAHGMSYLDGAILAYPGQIGSPEARIVVAGDETLWERHRDLVLDLAGASTYAGGDPGAANVVDTGLTGVFYFSSVAAFVEALRYLRAAGVREYAVVDLISHVTAQLDVQLREIVERTMTGNDRTDQATLAVYHEAGVTFLDAVQAKVAAPLLTTTLEMITTAMDRGLGDKDISALVTLPDSTA